MATEFRVSVDLAQLLQIGPVVRAQVFGQLAHAVEGIAQAGVERWQQMVLKAPLWDGERRAYADSIRYRMTGPFAAEIVSDYKYVEDIERGRPAYDLKKMLQTSLKTRVSKKGKLYLIIPFRHNTPGNGALAPAMPKPVYAAARQLSATSVVGHGWRLGGFGSATPHGPHRVRQRTYKWGDKLSAMHIEGLSPKQKKQAQGMYRFDASAGGGKGSTYLTFRTMVEGSSGWVIAPKPGLFIAQKVSESLQRTADQDLPAALQRDLDAA